MCAHIDKLKQYLYYNSNKNYPTTKELAQILNCDEKTVNKILKLLENKNISLNNTIDMKGNELEKNCLRRKWRYQQTNIKWTINWHNRK